MGVLVLVAAFAQVLSALAGQDAVSYDIGAINPPDGMPIGDFGGISGDHWLGVEPLTGRDVFARLVLALQFSLGLAVGVALVMVLLGLAVAVAVRRGNGRGLLATTVLSFLLLAEGLRRRVFA